MFATMVTDTEKQITVCHISPLHNTRGGVTSAVMNYVEANDWPVAGCFIESHCDGTTLQKFFHMVRAFGRALVLCRSRQIDVMHAHVGDFPSIYRKMLVTWPFFAFCRCQRILHMHGAAFLNEYERQPAIGRWLVRRFLGKFDLVIALSEQWRSDLQARFVVSQFLVLPNAVEVPAETPPRDMSAPRAFLFLGLIGARKGVFDLLQAVRDLAAKNLEAQDAAFTLRIGGNGDTGALHAAIDTYNLAGIVTCLGWIEGAVRDTIMRTSHVLVLPSYAEGAPMAVIEAMSSGMPIIATRVGAIPELVEDGKSGLLIEPGDVAALTAMMDRLARDDALWRQMSTRSHAIAQDRFSLALHKTSLLAAYRSLLKEGPKGARHGR